MEARVLPATRIQSLQFCHSVIANQPMPIGGALEQVVVDHRQGAVRGQMYIALDHVHAQFDSGTKRGQRVLGELVGVAAVAAEQHSSGSELGSKSLGDGHRLMITM